MTWWTVVQDMLFGALIGGAAAVALNWLADAFWPTIPPARRVPVSMHVPPKAPSEVFERARKREQGAARQHNTGSAA